MAHDGNSRGEAVQRLPLPRDGDRAEPKSASGRGPVGGLSRLDLKTPAAGPVTTPPEPLPRFTPPQGVTKTAATPSTTPDIPLPNERTARAPRTERPAGRTAPKAAPKALPTPPA